MDMKTKKQTKTTAKEMKRSFSSVVGADTYEVWVHMLRELIPDGRTHRLAVMVAGMLHYAVGIAAAKKIKEKREGSLALSLLEAGDATEPSHVEDLIHDAVAQLFKDAKVRPAGISIAWPRTVTQSSFTGSTCLGNSEGSHSCFKRMRGSRRR
jgi:hypothetical protein